MSRTASAAAPDRATAAGLRILHVIAGLDPAHGGPSYSVPRLCAELGGLGAEVSLLTVASPSGDRAAPDAPGVRVAAHPQSWSGAPLLRSLRLSNGLARALTADARAVDVVHNHGVWLAPNLQAAAAAARAGVPFVCSPRGMLSRPAMAFSARRKQLVWGLGQRRALEGAACLHATSEAEYADLRALGLASPVAIVPNGVDLGEAASNHGARGPTRTLLSLGRLHPKKGLETLVRAWARLEAERPDWRLRIVGPAEGGHDAELAALAARLGARNLSIEGPVYGAAKAALFAEAELFVAPTLSENFGLTVAEALAAGVPAICTTGAPWAELASERCGWWVDQGLDALAEALAAATRLPPAALAAMGARGRALVQQRYGWRRVAEDMAALYRWLAGVGERPRFVRTD